MSIISNNEQFKSIVERKRVAIVGPAPYLLESTVGSIIDEYDVVIRINDIIPPSKLFTCYGSRTDVMFHNCGTDWMCGLEEKIEDSKEEWESLKMVVCPAIKAVGSDNDYLNWPDDYVSDVVENFEKVNYSNIPFYWIGVKDYKALWSLVGVEPNCGILATMITLCCDIEELLVTGFSFYSQGSSMSDVYCEGHWPNSVPKSSNYSGGHSQDRQKELFRNLCTSDSRLKIDSTMNDILGLNRENSLKV
tara:strand:- start:3468 stop:4211 length:744 start_codon:yes stop_codon:yes gene_type:complete